MVALWITLGLIVSTFCVSILGALFSIVGIGALFSGAVLAVWAMAGSLELAKFVLAAYIHQRWGNLNRVFRTYLVFAIVVLSLITSMGIFGFLSDAYQSATLAMDASQIKIETQKTQLANFKNEIDRLNKAIDEIPVTRISRRMKARAEADPMIVTLNQKIEKIEAEISTSNLGMLEIKKKVGPLIYVAKAFNMAIDDVVKYFILIFVTVFDPLAICLVIAMSQALESRRKGKEANKEAATASVAFSPAPSHPVAEVAAVTDTLASELSEPHTQPTSPPAPQVEQPTAAPATPEVKPAATVASTVVPHGGDDEEMLLMRFTDEPSTTTGNESSAKDKNGNAV